MPQPLSAPRHLFGDPSNWIAFLPTPERERAHLRFGLGRLFPAIPLAIFCEPRSKECITTCFEEALAK